MSDKTDHEETRLWAEDLLRAVGEAPNPGILRKAARSYLSNREQMGRLRNENAALKGALRNVLPYAEHRDDIEPPEHGGRCSPMATPCDGVCATYGYWKKALRGGRALLANTDTEGET